MQILVEEQMQTVHLRSGSIYHNVVIVVNKYDENGTE